MRLRLAFAGPGGVIYGVNEAGDLLWFQVTDPAEAARALRDFGDFHWHWIVRTGDEREHQRPKSWHPRSAEVIARGTWGNVLTACAADNGVIYAIKADGHLHRFRYNPDVGWAKPYDLGGPRWDLMWDLIDGRDGVLYARDRHGVLYRFHDSDPTGTPKLPLRVETVSGGWNTFSKVLAGPRGVLYATVASTGQLLQFDDPSGDGSGFRPSAGRAVMGPGLNDTTARAEDWRRHSYYFSASDGTIYGIRPPSMTKFFPALDWFRHDGSSWAPGSGGTITYNLQIAELEGYCTPYTARPWEQPVSFRISTSRATSISVRYHRLSFIPRRRLREATRPLRTETILPPGQSTILVGSEPIATSPGVATDFRVAPDDAWARGCGWPETFQLHPSTTWRSGVYAARCRDQRGFECLIPFIVPAREPESEILTLFNTNTWNAYNYWGGQCYYADFKASRSTRLSFARPNDQLFDGIYDWNDRSTCINHSLLADLWIYGWLETKGYRSDAMSDFDFHCSSADALGRYKVIVLTSHPEYWSTEMFDNLRGYLDRGGSLFYLGGNGIYYRIAFSGDGSALDERGPRVTLRNLSLRHERALLGVAFFLDGWRDSPGWSSGYEVRDVSGLSEAEVVMAGLVPGDRLGLGGFNGKASGGEVDRALLSPIASDPRDPRESAELSPAGTAVLASGTQPGVDDGNMVMFRYPASRGTRGLVFSVGSIAFGGALWLDEKLEGVLDRALRMALPPR